eukprot:COSAG04_NODE_160_length_22034_cov_4.774151_13_plen_144_part_00
MWLQLTDAEPDRKGLPQRPELHAGPLPGSREQPVCSAAERLRKRDSEEWPRSLPRHARGDGRNVNKNWSLSGQQHLLTPRPPAGLAAAAPEQAAAGLALVEALRSVEALHSVDARSELGHSMSGADRLISYYSVCQEKCRHTY